MSRSKLRLRVALVCLLSTILPLTTSSCTQEIPNRITVEPENPPRFAFTKGEDSTLLYVYHVSVKLLNQGVPGKNIRPDNPDMVWWIEGKRREDGPITYGIVPVDMREIVPAQPLVEGEHYLVSGHQSGSGGTIGKQFTIRNGLPVWP